MKKRIKKWWYRRTQIFLFRYSSFRHKLRRKVAILIKGEERVRREELARDLESIERMVQSYLVVVRKKSYGELTEQDMHELASHCAKHGYNFEQTEVAVLQERDLISSGERCRTTGYERGVE